MSKVSHMNRDVLITKKCITTHLNCFKLYNSLILQCLNNETFKTIVESCFKPKLLLWS